jgi:TIR domain
MTATAPQPESRIFISYRREDSSGHVLALLPALRAQFGADRIFKDTDNIPAGVDFVKFIRRELETCAVLLAVIGRDWLTVQDPRLNRRRLDNPEDFLRVEVATALKNERIRVIPVLVERGVMPAAEDLPPDLAALAHRNAIELSDARWESDVGRLVEAIQRACAAPVDKPVEPTAQRPELQNLQKRRAREIASHLANAREGFEARDYEAALWSCEKALLLDQQSGEALELLDRIRKATDQQKIDGWLKQARVSLTASDLANASDLIDQALALEPTSNDGLALRQELLKLRREREQNRERTRMADAASARARTRLEEEEFESAIRHAEDALALVPDAVEAQEIRSRALETLDERRHQREHKRRAQQAVIDARAKFAAGEYEAGLELLRDFTPPHELVWSALLDFQKEADAVDQRRRRVTEQAAAAERAEALSTAIASARDSFARGDLEDTIRHAGAALALDAACEEAIALRDRAEAALEERRTRDRHDRLAGETIARARIMFNAKDYEAALNVLADVTPPHAAVDQALTELKGELERIEAQRRQEEEEAERLRLEVERLAAERKRAENIRRWLSRGRASLEREDFAAAIRDADEVLRIDPESSDALHLRKTAASSRQRQIEREEQERLAQQAAENARAEAARLADEQRQSEAHARGRAEADRRRRALASAIAAIDDRLAAERLDEADRLLAQSEGEFPAAPELAALRRRAQTARDRLAAHAREGRVQALLADAGAALDAKDFNSARSKAGLALALEPGNGVAQSILTSAARELRRAGFEAARPRSPRLGIASVVALAIVLGIWYSSTLPPRTSPAQRTPPTANAPASTSNQAATGPAQVPQQAPVQIQAPSPTPAQPAPLANPPEEKKEATAEELREQRLAPLREQGRGQVRNGQKLQALETVNRALRIAPGDPALESVLDSLLRDGERITRRAKAAASNAGAAPSQAAFAEGLKLEEEATQEAAANQKDPAIRSFWRAAERFVAARSQAVEASEQQRIAAEQAHQKQLELEKSKTNQTAADQTRLNQPQADARQKPSSPQAQSKPPVVNRAEEERRVTAVIRRYESGYDSLNPGEVRAAYPSQPDLTRLFSEFRSYDLQIQIQKIDISLDGTSAVVLAQVAHSFRSKVSGPQSIPPQSQIFTLKKQDNAWTISQVLRR